MSTRTFLKKWKCLPRDRKSEVAQVIAELTFTHFVRNKSLGRCKFEQFLEAAVS